jgi:hypothetical protein
MNIIIKDTCLHLESITEEDIQEIVNQKYPDGFYIQDAYFMCDFKNAVISHDNLMKLADVYHEKISSDASVALQIALPQKNI